MEKFSSFERVVGKISEKSKDKILKNKAEQFDDQVFEELEGKEREKTLDELKIIDLANNASNEIRKKYGMDNFNIPSANVHIIKESEWPKDRHDSAFYNTANQGIAMREQPARIVFMRNIFHEMLHFKSYSALQITIGKNPELKDYRVGLTINTRDGKKRYFTNLNEAVTEELTRRFVGQISSDNFFSKEIKQTKSIVNKYPAAKTGSKEFLFNEDTLYAEVKSPKSWREVIERLFGRKKIFTERFIYQKERNVLKVLIDKIFARSKEKFNNKEEIFEIFAKGMITGNIIPLGKLIDGIFGKGTLRNIGELDKNIKKQEVYVQSL